MSSNFPLNFDAMESSFVYDEVLSLSSRGLEVSVASRRRHGLVRVGPVDVFGLRHLGQHPLEGVKKIRNAAPMLLRSPPKYLIDPAESLTAMLHAALILEIVKEREPDVIHAHFLYPEGWSAFLASRISNKPLIVTTHGYDLLTLPEVGYGLRLKKQFEPLVKRVASHATRIVASSDVLVNEAVKLVGRPSSERIVKLPNGVDLERFRPESGMQGVRSDVESESTELVVLTTKSLHPVYGISHLLKAAELVKRVHPFARFHIAGSGRHLMVLRQLAHRLGLEDVVTFLGTVPRSRIPQLHRASTMSVIPSLLEGGGAPLTCLEAMASAKPVVASGVGGIPEAITDGWDGLLVPPKNPQAIAEKICHIIDETSIAGRIGLHARKTVEERFNIKDRVSRLVRVYEDVLEQQRASRDLRCAG